jgi:hypothetical protein
MIIFDLDGTLADCEHRRHFVDPNKNIDYEYSNFGKDPITREPTILEYPNWHRKDNWSIRFKPDWKSFYEACDKDVPITSTIHMLEYIGEGKEYGSDTPWVDYEGVEIWSGRCESVRDKTEKWLFKNIRHLNSQNLKLKMRPIGDSTPDEILKEKWLDEAIAQRKTIDFVFDDRPKVVRMWHRRGIFVFNCAQHDQEF